MTDKHDNPLRLDPPVRRSDPALGERLALLARSSTPTSVRHRAWRAPLAGLAIVVGTGGLAYGAQTVVHSRHAPSAVVPGADLSLAPLPSSADDATDGTDSTGSTGSTTEGTARDRMSSPTSAADPSAAGTVAAASGGATELSRSSASATATAPGQVLRSGEPGASGHPSRSPSAQGRPSYPGAPSTAAPGRGRHTRGIKPTTAASPSGPAARPTVPPTPQPSLTAGVQGVE